MPARRGKGTDFLEELLVKILFWALVFFLLSGFYHICVRPWIARGSG